MLLLISVTGLRKTFLKTSHGLSKDMSDMIKMRGKVDEIQKSNTFRVRLETGLTILAYLSGRMRQSHIKVVAGDIVEVEISPYDLTRGRIVYRER